jgi:DNA-binding MarR family transcriptional regulator
MQTTATDRSLAQLLTEVRNGVVQRLAVTLRAYDCSVEEWWVLSALAESPGRPMNEVTSLTMLPKPSFTKLIDRMVADNLVYRRQDTVDRRRLLLYATDIGLGKYTRAKDAVGAEGGNLATLLGTDCLEDLHLVLARAASRLS